jgi:hypothetical protein
LAHRRIAREFENTSGENSATDITMSIVYELLLVDMTSVTRIEKGTVIEEWTQALFISFSVNITEYGTDCIHWGGFERGQRCHGCRISRYTEPDLRSECMAAALSYFWDGVEGKYASSISGCIGLVSEVQRVPRA